MPNPYVFAQPTSKARPKVHQTIVKKRQDPEEERIEKQLEKQIEKQQRDPEEEHVEKQVPVGQEKDEESDPCQQPPWQTRTWPGSARWANISGIVREREQARANGNYQTADTFRNVLWSMGVRIHDDHHYMASGKRRPGTEGWWEAEAEGLWGWLPQHQFLPKEHPTE